MGIATSFMHATHFPHIQNSICYATKMVVQLAHLFLKTFYSIKEIVTDDGLAFVQAVEYLSKQYCINHI